MHFQGTLRSNGSLHISSPYRNGHGNSNGNGNGYGNGHGLNHGLSHGVSVSDSTWSLALSPPPSEEARYAMLRPRNLAERARLNVA